jgi:hypothetical protein
VSKRHGMTTHRRAVGIEEMTGWKALIDAVPSLLPNLASNEEWWDAVAEPPFAANPTLPFSR